MHTWDRFLVSLRSIARGALAVVRSPPVPLWSPTQPRTAPKRTGDGAGAQDVSGAVDPKSRHSKRQRRPSNPEHHDAAAVKPLDDAEASGCLKHPAEKPMKSVLPTLLQPHRTSILQHTLSTSVNQGSLPSQIPSSPEWERQLLQQPTGLSMNSGPTDVPVLCPEQAALVDLILRGCNVFYTGSAGCGKSAVLKALVKILKKRGKNVQIVAPTGRAALNVGGITTWSFAGWTPDSHKKPLDKLKTAAVFGTAVKKRLVETDVLVIDEVSMVENLHFQRLNEIMKVVRYRTTGQHLLPFGGCQIVVTGDFCQLPPVRPFQHCIDCGKELTQALDPDGRPVHVCHEHGTYADEDKWAFRSKAWEECEFTHVHLKTIHRQNDQTFIRMLQKCRLGYQLDDSEIDLLMNHECQVSQATKLYSTRKEAEDVNRAAFIKLPGFAHTYWALDKFHGNNKHFHWMNMGQEAEWKNVRSLSPPRQKKPLQALYQHRFSECVELKKGMLVVLLANIDLGSGLCNGSQGTICDWEDYEPDTMSIRRRVLQLEHAGVMEKEIKEFITSECAPVKKWPVVRFHNGVVRTVYAECSVTQLGDEEPYSMLMRTQLPLAPAWAMTIHKSQGLTLDRVTVDLSRAFQDGQIYVALSRAKGLRGLKIEGDGAFLKKKLMVNAEVAAFMREKFGDIYGPTEAEGGSPEP